MKWLVGLLGFWFVIFVPFIPTVHDFSDVTKIEITVLDRLTGNDWPNKLWLKTPSNNRLMGGEYLRVLVLEEEIRAFEQVMGTTWEGTFVRNSHESLKFIAHIQVYRENGDVDSFMFTESEWGRSGKTPESLLKAFVTFMK